MPNRFAGRLVAAMLLSICASALSAAELKVADGKPAPVLELRDLSGRTHRLADHRGKVVLVNFWATWCEPCREEMPSIAKLKDALGERAFAVLAVNVDEPEARIEKFLSMVPLDFPVLVDAGRVATRRWNVRVLPASFVIGTDGRVHYVAIGELDWSAPAVASRIADLLPGK